MEKLILKFMYVYIELNRAKCVLNQHCVDKAIVDMTEGGEKLQSRDGILELSTHLGIPFKVLVEKYKMYPS